MRKAKVYVHNVFAGILTELEVHNSYSFQYEDDYFEAAVSLTMPIENRIYTYKKFPPFFEGLLPEGNMLEGLLRQLKIDGNDYFSQLLATGEDLVGAVTVYPDTDE